MKHIYNIIVIAVLLIAVSCQKGTRLDSEILTINLENATVEPISANEIFSSVEYVFLETLPECLLIDGRSTVYATDKYIVAHNMRLKHGAYLFDRQTGKFLYEIGKPGQGPDEYTQLRSRPFYDKEELFYVIGNYRWLGIDIHSNKVVERVFKPIHDNEFHSEENFLLPHIDNIYKMDSSHYIAYTINDTGDFPYLLAIFDKDGGVVKTYPNHQKYKDYQHLWYGFEGHFYDYKNQVYFKEYWYNDTIFQVNVDTIIPHIAFDLGKRKPDYYEMENASKNLDCYWITFVQETDRYLFFNYKYNQLDFQDGFYDKKTKKTRVSSSKSEIFRGYIPKEDYYPPFHILNINKSGEAVGMITASDMSLFMSEHEDVKFPEKLRNLKEDDNPIVAIAKLK
jgi:hypothetical protein